MFKSSPPEELIRVSSFIGSNHLLVQGPGGNTSYKYENNMWIKASGKWLSRANQEEIFVNLDLNILRKKLGKNVENPLDHKIVLNSKLRPSIETTMHALMPHRVVLHSHPVDLLTWLVRKDGEKKLLDLLDGIKWTWVPYTRPGLDLTKAIKERIDKKEVDVIILGNHGLVVGGNNCSVAQNLMLEIINRCKKLPRYFLKPKKQNIIKLAEKFSMRNPNYEIIHGLAIDKTSFDYCNKINSILYPDQAVFLGKKMPCISINTEFNGRKKISSYFVILEKQGVLISKKADKKIDEMLRCHIEILLRTKPNVNLNYLHNKEVNKLLNWEAEKYRQRMVK